MAGPRKSPQDWDDRISLIFVKVLRFIADSFFARRYAHRAVVLETVAAVPGMVGGMLQHLKMLRHIRDDRGWVRELLDEAENERMHLMTFVQIGSKASVLDRDSGGRGARWRRLFGREPFVGVDIEPGENVDAVLDITKDIRKFRKTAEVFQFRTVICPHVLEHVEDPFAAARNIAALTEKGGHVLVTTPWVQSYHPFPEDYWRFSFAGLRKLFERMEVVGGFYSDSREETGYFIAIDGCPDFTRDALRIEGNLFQFLLEDLPEQDMFEDDFDGKKTPLSRLFMPAMSVNLVFRKN
jgi:hypothetical protein